MSNNCPKCNEKLSPFYMKQTCPKCNTNLVYYDLDKRLQEDHERAMREQAAVDKVLNNIKTSAFGGKEQIFRFVMMFSPLLWMCLPMFTVKDFGLNEGNEDSNITLISIIMDIINGTLSFDDIFSKGEYLTSVITMVCIILFSLAVIVSSLFSVGEKALKRNMIFSTINFVVLIGCVLWSLVSCSISIGVIIIILTYILEFFLHKKIDKKLNK